MLNWIEVEAAALGNNIAEFRRRLGPKVKLGAVVKSNAYGHGMLEVASVVRDRVDWLCVNNLDEAVRLHEADGRGLLAEGVIDDHNPVGGHHQLFTGATEQAGEYLGGKKCILSVRWTRKADQQMTLLERLFRRARAAHVTNRPIAPFVAATQPAE